MKPLAEILPWIWCVEVPKDAYNFQDTLANGILFNTGDNYYETIWFEGDKIFDFEVLGTVSASEISFDVSGILKKDEVNGLFEIYDSTHTIDSWVNSEGNLGSITRTEFGLANESFRSLLLKHGFYWENPIEKPFVSVFDVDGTGTKSSQEYQQYEQNKLQGILVVLKKVK